MQFSRAHLLLLTDFSLTGSSIGAVVIFVSLTIWADISTGVSSSLFMKGFSCICLNTFNKSFEVRFCCTGNFWTWRVDAEAEWCIKDLLWGLTWPGTTGGDVFFLILVTVVPLLDVVTGKWLFNLLWLFKLEVLVRTDWLELYETFWLTDDGLPTLFRFDADWLLREVLLRLGRRALLRLAKLVVGDFGLRRFALAVSFRGIFELGEEELRMFVGPF